MKNFFNLIMAAIIFSGCQSQDSIESLKKQDNHIVIGVKDSLYSEILGELRKLFIHVPETDALDDGATKYPVLYLLDGDAHFHSVMAMMRQFSVKTGSRLMPEMIVVGIPNTDRTRDLTPTHVDFVFGDSAFARTSGGGKAFLDFLEKELIPYIEKQYPATSFRTFVGHSFGGLTVVNTLYNRQYLFNNYIAIDPSLWWDDQLLMRMADSVLLNTSFKKRSLYVGVANTMRDVTVTEVHKDTTSKTRHIRSILQFNKSVEANPENGLVFDWKYYENDDHGSVPFITEYDALRFLFSWHEVDRLYKFFNEDSETTAEDVIDAVNTNYKELSEHFGYSLIPKGSVIDGHGHRFLEKEMPEKAYAMFNMNIDNFPETPGVYDSMGDYYINQSDTIKAIEYFTKALEYGSSPVSKEKLDKLRP